MFEVRNSRRSGNVSSQMSYTYAHTDIESLPAQPYVSLHPATPSLVCLLSLYQHSSVSSFISSLTVSKSNQRRRRKRRKKTRTHQGTTNGCVHHASLWLIHHIAGQRSARDFSNCFHGLSPGKYFVWHHNSVWLMRVSLSVSWRRWFCGQNSRNSSQYDTAQSYTTVNYNKKDDVSLIAQMQKKKKSFWHESCVLR